MTSDDWRLAELVGQVKRQHRRGVSIARFGSPTCQACLAGYPCPAIDLAQQVERLMLLPQKPVAPPNVEVRKGGGTREKASA